MSGWQDVLDIQLDLIRFWQGRYGEKCGRTFGESMARTELEEGNPASVWIAEHLTQLETSSLLSADPFYVDDEMMDVVEAAAETFRPEPFQATDLLTADGFVVLPRGMTMIDRKGRRLAFSSFAWKSFRFLNPEGSRDGVLLSLYSHILQDEDDFSHDDRLSRPEPREDGDRLTVEERQRLAGVLGTPYSLLHVTPWLFGAEVPKGEAAEKLASWWTPVQAFLRLSLQTISDRYQAKPPRAASRRWSKARLPDDKYITVIRLRRPKSHRDGESSPVDWTHRWIVGGHWHKYWFPSLGVHRQVWVAPYQKGPPEKPLIVRRGRAFELVR